MHSYELYSHPQRPLFEHLRNVGISSRRIVNSKYMDNRELFADISYLIGVSHDFGKSTEAFQRMLKTGIRSEKARHGLLSSLFGYFLIKNFLEKKGKIDDFWYIPPISWLVINKHHGDIGDIRDEINKLRDKNKIRFLNEQLVDIKSYEELKRIYSELLSTLSFESFDLESFFALSVDDLMKEIYREVKRVKRKKEFEFYFEILFFYSVLLDADKLDASGSQLPSRIHDLNRGLVDAYKSTKFSGKDEIDELREKIYKEVNESLNDLDPENDRILSINLPTGTGKTLTGFSFALGLREKVKSTFRFEPRIIYSLPFLSIIDQNASIISEIFALNGFTRDFEVPSNLFLKHHHLADVNYKEMRDGELNVVDDTGRSLLLTEGWHSEVIITTFVQFFHSVITNRNRAARKFHNIVNSIIMLDEVQSIPHKYWLIINKVLKHFAKRFNCWIILITATKPLLFGENEIKELIDDRESYFKFFDRFNFSFNLEELDFDKFKEMVLDEVIKRPDDDVMVVLNTISASKDLYNYLKEAICRKSGIEPEDSLDRDGICNLPGLELINMSTHVLPGYRLARINRIRNDDKRKIIITTQLVEAGVDISTDVIYRDIAPLDSIIQTAGRCNRNYSSKKGELNVVLLKDDNDRFFFSYVYDPFLIDITREILDKAEEDVSEKSFTFSAANEYYNLIKERGSQNESLDLIDHLKRLNLSETSKFNLIEKRSKKISIFIELNKDARKLREVVEEIRNIKDFSRKLKMEEIRKHINMFTLSIDYRGDLHHLPFLDGFENFRYVPMENLHDWYMLDTGFKCS